MFGLDWPAWSVRFLTVHWPVARLCFDRIAAWAAAIASDQWSAVVRGWNSWTAELQLWLWIWIVLMGALIMHRHRRDRSVNLQRARWTLNKQTSAWVEKTTVAELPPSVLKLSKAELGSVWQWYACMKLYAMSHAMTCIMYHVSCM